MLAGMKAEYSLIGRDDLERVKAQIAIHDDELIECDPTKAALGAAEVPGLYIYEYHRTFSKRDGSLVDSTNTKPGPMPSAE